MSTQADRRLPPRLDEQACADRPRLRWMLDPISGRPVMRWRIDEAAARHSDRSAPTGAQGAGTAAEPDTR